MFQKLFTIAFICSFICFAYASSLRYNNEIFDVIIVGAGYSGLSTARKLSQSGLKVMVLEASDRAGGRTYDYFFSKYNSSVELGGQWLAPKDTQPHAHNLIVKELGFETYSGSYDKSGKSFLRSFSGDKVVPDLANVTDFFPIETANDIKSALNTLQVLSSQFPSLKTPWTHPKALEFDSITFDSWIKANVKDPEAIVALQIICTTMIAQEAKTVSFLHILFYFASSGGVQNIVIHDQDYRVKGGLSAPAHKLASDLGNKIMFNYAVYKISYDQDIVEVCAHHTDIQTQGHINRVNRTPNNHICLKALKVVVTGSPSLLNKIHFEPELPYTKIQLSQRMPMGNSIKFSAIYPKPFWRDDSYSGTLLATRRYNNILLSNCFDNTPNEGQPGVLLCFAEGDASNQMMKLTEKERQQTIKSYLSYYLGPKVSTDMNDFIYHHWAAQPYIGGAYSSYFPPSVWTQFGEDLRENLDSKIFFAGTEYATEGFGYVDGAIQSGESVAEQIKSLLF